MSSVGNQDDLYKFTSNSYSEQAIYSRSVDNRGHQSHVRVQCPPALVNSLNALYKELGYTSVAAFFRDAAIHRLRYWTKNSPNPEQVQYYLSLARIEEIGQEMEYLDDVIRSAQLKLDQAHGSKGRQKMIVNELRVIRDRLPDYVDDRAEAIERLIAHYG